MSARDDYKVLAYHAYSHDRTRLGEEAARALDEIDRLRRFVSIDEWTADESQPSSKTLEAIPMTHDEIEQMLQRGHICELDIDVDDDGNWIGVHPDAIKADIAAQQGADRESVRDAYRAYRERNHAVGEP